jgi:hypothetical protein
VKGLEMVSTSEMFKRKSDEFSKLVNNTKGNEMKYTAEQLRPVRPENLDIRNMRADKLMMFWTLNRNTKDKFGWGIDRLHWYNGFMTGTEWVVPIQEAPRYLKPLAYPENKPKQDGIYLVHDKIDDEWYCWWIDTTDAYRWDEFIDYFIPYKLDIPVRLDEENKMDVIWETDKLEVGYTNINSIWFEPKGTISESELTAFARHWLELKGKLVVEKQKFYKTQTQLEDIANMIDEAKGYADTFSMMDYVDLVNNIAMVVLDVNKREPISDTDKLDMIPENITEVKITYGGGGLTKTFAPSYGAKKTIRKVAEAFGYEVDVRKRESEIRACPNPECSGTADNIKIRPHDKGNYNWEYQMTCELCGYSSPYANSSKEAIRLHNLISSKRKYYE